MIRDEVSFTGLTVDPQQILSPRKFMSGSFPVDWIRIQFVNEQRDFSTSKFDRWLEGNIDGRWGSFTTSTALHCYVVVYFEKPNDAIMFRLKSGETAWREEM